MNAKNFAAFLLLALVAGAAEAAIFTVTLANGGTFETRYRPRTADFDPNYALLYTDQGSLIALKKSEIVDISTNLEVGGFGYQLNETTTFLGWSPNESEDEEAKAAGGAADSSGGSSAPAGGHLNNANDFQVQDFVDIPASGVIPGGMSLGGEGGSDSNEGGN